MEKTESQGGRRTQKAKGKASQEERNQVRVIKNKCNENISELDSAIYS